MPLPGWRRETVVQGWDVSQILATHCLLVRLRADGGAGVVTMLEARVLVADGMQMEQRANSRLQVCKMRGAESGWLGWAQ